MQIFFLAAGEGAGGHIVLHDLNAVFILEVDTGDFIERHTVPHADETDRLCANVVEQVGNGCLTAGNKNTVREISL